MGDYSEAWLQEMLDCHPEIFPIEQIEPGLGTLHPVCRELPLEIGGGRTVYLDNFFVTERGGLVLVETKLWRNPEARRKVVVQALEYAAAVFRLDFERLEIAVRRARRSESKPDLPLFDLVTAAGPVEYDDASFIDAVSRNLRRGRAVIAVVGDGIREDIAPLAELLQSHAGHRFVFALVELCIYETPIPGARLILPSVLAQTTLIERGVVQIDERAEALGRIMVAADTPQPTHAVGRSALGLSEDEFLEIVDRNSPGAGQLLRSFLDEAADHGFYPDVKGTMTLKHDAPDGGAFNLAMIRKNLMFDTMPGYTPKGAANRSEAGQRYVERLAELIGGEAKASRDGYTLRKHGRFPKITELLPEHATEWLAAMDEYVKTLLGGKD
jgi:hypothetical protein